MRLNRPGAGVLAAVAVLAALLFLGRGLWAVMFARNPQYAIGPGGVEIPGEVLAKTPKEIRDITGIHEGVNLFSFDAAEARERLLGASLNFEDATIEKRMPRLLRDEATGAVTGTVPASVKIDVRPRIPVARFYNGHGFQALDRNGLVFAILPQEAGKYGVLPTILTSPARPPKGDAFVNGRTLRGAKGTPVDLEERMARTVEVLNVLAKYPVPPVRILSANVEDDTYLVLETDQLFLVGLVWEEIGTPDRIREAFDKLGEVLRDGRANTSRRIDVILTPVPRIFGRQDLGG